MRFSAASKSTICAAATCVLLFAGAPADAQSISDKLNNWLFGTYAAPSASNNAANTAAEVDCPGVNVRQGASTLSITQPGAEAGPMTTRYQVSIAQTARECAPLGSVMTMKVGVEGRVLLGPAGGTRCGSNHPPARSAPMAQGRRGLPRATWSTRCSRTSAARAGSRHRPRWSAAARRN